MGAGRYWAKGRGVGGDIMRDFSIAHPPPPPPPPLPILPNKDLVKVFSQLLITDNTDLTSHLRPDI